MIKAIRAANAAGYRAGRANPRLVTPGGTRGVKRVQQPTNPFADVFHPERRNWFLAQVWDSGHLEGMFDRLVTHQKIAFAFKVFKMKVGIYG